jgi:hypothetical protein
MASPLFVNDGGDNSDGTTWVKAYNALDDGLLNVDADGIIYIASNHVETEGANYTLGSANDNITVISVQESTTTYETMVAGGGSVNTGVGAYDVIFTNNDIYVGLSFTAGDDVFFNTASKTLNFIDVTFTVADFFKMTLPDIAVNLYNSNIILETVGKIQLSVGGGLFWKGGTFSFSGGSVGLYLFDLSSTSGGNIIVEGVDFQDLDGGDSLVSGALAAGWNVLFKRCKVPAALGALMGGAITGPAYRARFHSVSNSDIIYQFQENYYEGQINEDTGVYLDATYDGSNGYSAKMVSLATVKEWILPLRFKLAEIWISATGKTLTVELLTDNVTLQNDEFWIEVEYPDSTTKALGNILSTKSATIVTTPVNLTASGKGAGDWTGESGTPVYQKTVADFTGVADEAVGMYTVWACLAKASTTVYVCPKIVVA